MDKSMSALKDDALQQAKSTIKLQYVINQTVQVANLWEKGKERMGKRATTFLVTTTSPDLVV